MFLNVPFAEPDGFRKGAAADGELDAEVDFVVVVGAPADDVVEVAVWGDEVIVVVGGSQVERAWLGGGQ